MALLETTNEPRSAQCSGWERAYRLRHHEPHQHAQRTALSRAAQILQHDAFARGCELHPPAPEARADA